MILNVLEADAMSEVEVGKKYGNRDRTINLWRRHLGTQVFPDLRKSRRLPRLKRIRPRK
jgi:hypothetical protein